MAFNKRLNLIKVNKAEFGEITSALEMRFLIYLADYWKGDETETDMFVHIPTLVREQLCDELKISINQYYNIVRSLKKKEIMVGRADFCRISKRVIEYIKVESR